MDFRYFMVFRFYFWILGVVLLTTFLVYCSKVNLLWWKIECKLKTAIWRGLRHLDWHPLPNRPKFKMAAFLIRTAKFFLPKVYFSYKYQSWQVIQNSINTNLLNLGFLIFWLGLLLSDHFCFWCQKSPVFALRSLSNG